MTPDALQKIDTSAIDALKSALTGALLQPSDSDYNDARQIWNGMFDKKPALIASCANTDDVICAVNFAREHNLLTAIKSGGHNSAGSGSCDGGLMIDMSNMNVVTVDEGARRARVEGGAIWEDFDRETQKHGLSAPGGLISATGVAGLSLAGGLGWLRGKFGLCIDNLVSVDIVTADGTLHTANGS